MAGPLSPEAQIDCIRNHRRRQKGLPDEINPSRTSEWKKWLVRASIGLGLVGGFLYLLSN